MTLPDHWIASWIEPEQEPTFVERYSPERDEIRLRWPKTAIDRALLRPVQCVRIEFEVAQPVVRARLFATAHGVYKAFVNGSRTGNDELAPDWTPYRSLLMVQETDVQPLIQIGRNALAFMIADGWWCGRIGMHGTSANFGDRLGLLAQLEMELADGSRQTIGTGDTFRSAPAEMVHADFLMGETHDLRLRQKGWTLSGFDDRRWPTVCIASQALDNLSPQIGPSATIVAELRCERVLQTPNGDTVLDFGRNLTGRLRGVLQGTRGTDVSFEYFQSLGPDGNCFDNVLAMNQAGRDAVILSGDSKEAFEFQFAFHGFRYVRMAGHRARPRAEAFTALALSSLQDPVGEFACSDERLNRLHSNIQWTLRSTMLSVPMDNPDRERVGWTGDMALVARTSMLMFDMQGFLERWLNCLREEQQPDGAVPMVIPMFDGYRDWFEARFQTCATSGWGDAAVVVPWLMYEAYGDKDILERSFPSMQRWLEYVRLQAAASLTEEDRQNPALAHLWRAGSFHFGDWLAPSARTLTPTGMYDGRHMALATKELLPTIWYARSASILADAAAVLGRGETADYRCLAAAIRESFCAAFVRNGRLVDERQGNYVLAAAFDMVPGQRDALVARLAELIHQRGDRLDTGFVSTAFLLQVLADGGHAGLAYSLLCSEQDPSWLYQVERGATTVWEMWDSIQQDGNVTRTSQIQPALGSVGEWLYGYVAGLRPASPGWDDIRIEPVLDERLSWARGSHRTRHGVVSAEWQRHEDTVRLRIELPDGTRGTVRLEANGPELIHLGGMPVAECPGLSVVNDGRCVAVMCPPGTYVFTAPFPAAR